MLLLVAYWLALFNTWGQMMAFFERSARTERELKWARIWFDQFAKFHQRCSQSDWLTPVDRLLQLRMTQCVCVAVIATRTSAAGKAAAVWPSQ